MIAISTAARHLPTFRANEERLAVLADIARELNALFAGQVEVVRIEDERPPAYAIRSKTGTLFAIFGVIAVLSYRATASLSEGEARLSGEAQRWRALEALFTRIEADFRQAVPRSARVGASREPAWLGTTFDGRSALVFTRAGSEFALEPGPVDDLPLVLEFDAASFVLTAMGRVNGGTARGDASLADRFCNLFFRI